MACSSFFQLAERFEGFENLKTTTLVVELAELLNDFVNGFIEGRGACGDADIFAACEPVRAEIGGAFDLPGLATETARRVDELGGVVAVVATDYHDGVVVFTEFVQRGLAILGRLADGVGEAHFRVGEIFAQGFDERFDAIDGLGGLRNHTDFFGGGFCFLQQRSNCRLESRL